MLVGVVTGHSVFELMNSQLGCWWVWGTIPASRVEWILPFTSSLQGCLYCEEMGQK